MPRDINRKPSYKRTPAPSLAFILQHGYGYSQLAAAVTGGFTVAPSVAASLTLFKLGAERRAPQYGSCLLVFVFYMTDFRLVQYIPKPAFSCLMVLAGLDMIRTWIIGSFLKTQAKLEWMVAPFLVAMAFSVGMLNAIFLGIAMSTFIFAANFYSAGTVRFVGSGLSLRSTVERGVTEANWLSQNGDRIQILILQHYLFFGNAQSVWTYVSTMFEEDNTSQSSQYQLPIPAYLIVDFTMVSGMDTSAIDVFREIVDLCKENKCRIFLAGVDPMLKSDLKCAGLKPDPRSVRFGFTTDLESALARAEDGLLSFMFRLEEKDEAEYNTRQHSRNESNVEDGFVYALKKIDIQHNLKSALELRDLRKYTRPIELEPGDVLVREQDDHGLYFVETGLMRVRHASGHSTMNMSAYSNSISRGTDASTGAYNPSSSSLGRMDPRAGTLGRQFSMWKEQATRKDTAEQGFRLARIGQGWVIGGIEASNGMRNPGVHVAISNCRLHHLPGKAIKEVEKTNPTLAMNLYKLLAHLSTKRQEVTIQQLGQFIRILHTPAPRLRGGKRDLTRLQLY